MDSSERSVYGDREGAAWNGRFRSKHLHPLFLFNQFGDLERCGLRPSNVHRAAGWKNVLRPVPARYTHGAMALTAGKGICIVWMPVTPLSDFSTFMRF